MAEIAEDPTAGPARRPTSSLPLRFEQLGGVDELPDLECLIASRARGEIEWEFIPFDEPLLAPLPRDLPESLGEVQRWLEGFTGAKSRAIAPAVVRLLHARYAGSPARRHRSLDDLAYGNTIVRLGTGYVRPSCLLSHLALSEVMLAPHLTRRGPNGAWLVRRGPRHPVTLAMADVQCWVPTALGDSNPLQTLINLDVPWHESFQLFEGFSTESAARQVLLRREPDSTPAPRCLAAQDLALAIGGMQRFEWEDGLLEAKFSDLRLTEPDAMGWEVLQALAGPQRADRAKAAVAAAQSERRARHLFHLGCADEPTADT